MLIRKFDLICCKQQCVRRTYNICGGRLKQMFLVSIIVAIVFLNLPVRQNLVVAVVVTN